MNELSKIQLKLKQLSDHPWVFGQHLQALDGCDRPANGQVCDLISSEGTWLARGHYNHHARIGFRRLSQDPQQPIDFDFFKGRIQAALELRRRYKDFWGASNAYRLVHSEADELSGLVIDIYNDIAVVEFFSKGMFLQRSLIQEVLQELWPQIRPEAEDSRPRHIHFFAERRIQKQESFDLRHHGSGAATIINEGGVQFHVSVDVKHKTGFYLDQRLQRQQLAQLATGKTVLDLCCFNGGFALAAQVAGQAARVDAVDLDPEAIAWAHKNAELNQAAVHWHCADLRDYVQQPDHRNFYDIVILDPAKLTADRNRIQSALSSYIEMNRLAIGALKPGGLLLSCSCTGLVSESDFLNCLRIAARQAGRNLKVVSLGGLSWDHPMSIFAPEGRYLKAVWAVVV